jgi:endonuclease YncB( thermonuclease family)
MKLSRVMLFLVVAALPVTTHGKRWRTYENCTLIENPANDGDSFHVRWNRRHYIFRLYFVDAPESDDSVPERVAEQAAYWGINPQEVIRLGKEAKKFTEKFLENGFTAYSKLADAMGRSEKDRDYAIIRVGEKDLAEELVRNGLARIHGMGIDLPDGTSERMMWWRLKSAEREAKANGRGAWGAATTAAASPFSIPRPSFTPVQSPPSMPATPPAQMPRIVPQSRQLVRPTAVFSTMDPDRQVGILQPGVMVQVLQAETPTMARVRFTTSDGKTYEALCRLSDLGL